MIKITLDTSCYDKKSGILLEELAKLQKDGLVELWHEIYSKSETDNWVSPYKERIMDLFYTFSKFKNDACAIPMKISNDSEKSHKYIEEKRGYTSCDLHRVHTKIDKMTYAGKFPRR
ncbi:hypothetical protein HZB03_05965, partial [Candidatus Woesearchaeota archaeon]|nr:hypothetical protein [Candidatus Woesearchaeota archaeon]